MLEFLCSFGEQKCKKVDAEFRKDFAWWKNFLPVFNRESILWMCEVKMPDGTATSNASLSGLGVVCEKEYIKIQFPSELQGKNIAYLEMMAIIVMVKVWSEKFLHKSMVFKCNNEVVVTVVNTGRARDAELVNYLRELAFLVARKFEFKAVHLPSQKNLLPDLLSRWAEGDRIHKKFYALIQGKDYIEKVISPNVFRLSHNW